MSEISQIYTFDEIDSTNDYAKKIAGEGAVAGTVVIAGRQTAGRGRMGRTFISPAGSGLYMSVIIRPGSEFADAVPLTSAAAVAVCRVIRRMTGADAGIKWVNDIYINEKKVCGILTEAVPDPKTGRLDSVVVGIGINCVRPADEVVLSMPEDVQTRIGWLFDKAENMSFTPAELAEAVAEEVISMSREIKTGTYIDEYKKYSIVLGKKIVFISQGEKQSALALDIDKAGGLVVLLPDNTQKTLSSGEISIRW